MPSLPGTWVGCEEQSWAQGSPGTVWSSACHQLWEWLCCFPSAAGLAPQIFLPHIAASALGPPLSQRLRSLARDPSVGINKGHSGEDKPQLLEPGLLGKGSATITGTGGSRSFLEGQREGLRGQPM